MQTFLESRQANDRFTCLSDFKDPLSLPRPRPRPRPRPLWQARRVLLGGNSLVDERSVSYTNYSTANFLGFDLGKM